MMPQLDIFCTRNLEHGMRCSLPLVFNFKVKGQRLLDNLVDYTEGQNFHKHGAGSLEDTNDFHNSKLIL